MQLYIKDSGEVQKGKPQRFFTSRQGQYLGHWLGAFHKGIPAPVIQHLYRKQWLSLMDDVCSVVAPKMYNDGHRGPVGIDCLIHKKNDSYFVHPIVEINPRYTMGQVAHSLSKRCNQSAIFSLAVQQTLPLSPPVINRGICQSGHMRLNDLHLPVGVFLTVSTEQCQRWCQRHNILHPPV